MDFLLFLYTLFLHEYANHEPPDYNQYLAIPEPQQPAHFPYHNYKLAARTIIIHEKADDFTTQPSGNAGKMIACGEIIELYQ